LWRYEKRNPDSPWLTGEAVQFLSHWIKPSDVGLEWGSGRSTLWFAKRVAELVSVEHDHRWYDIVRQKLQQNGIQNVSYHMISLNSRGGRDYVRVIDLVDDYSLDFVLVDGEMRGECVMGALRKLRPGGILVIDNAERYLESTSRSPDAIRGRVGDLVWRNVEQAIGDWRRLWTSNGVTDTAIFFCPCEVLAKKSRKV